MNRSSRGRERRRQLWTFAISLFFLFILLHTQAGASPVSGKLRIFIQPVSGSPPKEAWKSTEETFIRQQYRQMERMLTQKGIYEVVPESEVRKALNGKEVPGWKWKSGDWILAKEIGRAVGADYVMIMERGFQGFLYWRMTLINLTTGRQFEDQDHIVLKSGQPEQYRDLQRESYRRIFLEAKGDMLATAIRKGRLPELPPSPALPPQPKETPPVRSETPLTQQAAVDKPSLPLKTAGDGRPDAGPEVRTQKAPADREKPVAKQEPPGPPPRQKTAPPDAPAKPSSPASVATGPSSPPAVTSGGSAKNVKSAQQPAKAAADRPKMIVYDFDASADLRVAGLILAEALREELHQIGRFTLVNREDIVKVLEEHKLKQSGLLGEDGSSEIGKWLMAREIVTGKLSRLGSASILQAKRTEVETMNTRAIGSLKCEAGKEEELMDGMAGLARRLTDAQ